MIVLQDIADDVIAPICPKGSHLSTKTIGRGEKNICLEDHKDQEDFGIISTTNTINHRHLRLIINWTKNISDTERISNDLYSALNAIKDTQYSNFFIKFISMDDIFPIDNKRNKEEVYSKIIDFEIYYE